MEGSIMIGEEEVGLNGKGYKRMSNAHNVSRNMKKNKAHFANLDRYRKKGSIHNMNSNNSNKGSIDYSHNSYNNRKVFVELVGPTIKIDPW